MRRTSAKLDIGSDTDQTSTTVARAACAGAASAGAAGAGAASANAASASDAASERNPMRLMRVRLSPAERLTFSALVEGPTRVGPFRRRARADLRRPLQRSARADKRRPLQKKALSGLRGEMIDDTLQFSVICEVHDDGSTARAEVQRHARRESEAQAVLDVGHIWREWSACA